jgi:hypothetical protein
MNFRKGDTLDVYQTLSYCTTPTTVRLPVAIESGLSPKNTMTQTNPTI